MARSGMPSLSAPSVVSGVDLSRSGAAEQGAARFWASTRATAEDALGRIKTNQVLEQQQRAQAAVEAGAFQPRLMLDEVDEAYNEAGIIASKSQAALDVRRLVEQTRADIEAAHGYSVPAFMEAARSARTQYVQNAPTWLKGEIAPYFDAEISRHVDNLAASKREQDRTNAVARSETLLKDLGDEMETIAAGDPGYRENPRYVALAQQYDDIWDTLVASPLLGVDPEVAASAKRNFIGRIQGRSIVGQAGALYERLGPAAARDEIERLIFSPDIPMEMGDRQAFFNQALGEINRRDNERAEQGRQIGATVEVLKDNIGVELDENLAVVRAGASNTAEDWAALENTSAGYLATAQAWVEQSPGDPRAMAALADAERRHGEVLAARELDDFRVQFARKSPEQQRAILGQILLANAQGGELTDADLLILEQGVRIAEQTEEMIRTDPWGWAESQGHIPGTGALDPTDDGAIAATLAARRSYAGQVRDATGREPPLLRNDAEIAGLAARLRDPAAAPGALAAVARGAEDDAALILGQIAGREADGPALANAGALVYSGAGPDVAQTVAQGLAARAQSGTVLPGGREERTERREALAKVVGGAFAESPALFDYTISTAEAIYDAIGRDTEYSDATFERAIAMALGQSEDFGGVASTGRGRTQADVIAPPWLRRDRLDAVVRELDIGDLYTAGGQVRPRSPMGELLTPRDLRDYALVNVGPDAYRLVSPQGAYVQAIGPDGDTIVYELDLGALRPYVSQLHPDWVR